MKQPVVSPERAARWTSTAIPFALLRAAGQGGEAVGLLFAARALGPAMFGSVWAALLIARWGGIVGDWGATMRGPRDVALNASGAVRTMIRRRWIVSFGLTGLYITGAGLFTPWAIPLGLTLLARGANRDWMSLGRGRGLRAGVPSALQGVAVVVGGVIASDRFTFALVLGLAYGAAFLVSLRLNRPPASPVDGEVACSEPSGMLYANVADQVSASADSLLLVALRSTAESGLYAAASRASVALSTLVGLIAAGVVPAVVGHLASGRPRSQLRRAMFRRSVPAGILIAFAAPLAGTVTSYVFGRAYGGVGMPAAVLILAVAIAVTFLPLHIEAIALSLDGSYSRCLIAGAVVNVALNVVLQPLWGATGAAVAMVASVSVIHWSLWRVVHGAAPGAKVSSAPKPLALELEATISDVGVGA